MSTEEAEGVGEAEDLGRGEAGFAVDGGVGAGLGGAHGGDEDVNGLENGVFEAGKEGEVGWGGEGDGESDS